MKHLPAAGFTLIELLVVSAIMMVVIGGSIAGYVQFNEYQTLVTEGRTLENRIKMAQNRARIRATKLCDTLPDDPVDDFQGFRTTISSAGVVNTYELCGVDAANISESAAVTEPFTPTLAYGGGYAQYDFFTPQSRREPNIVTNTISIETTRNAYVITISNTGIISSEIISL
jgi:prepilin-type N-terminal cleavage/methylation domain-containing protein